MDQNLKISILLPVYNGEKTLLKSIESVLKQSYTNFELLILNDGSVDGSKKIIENIIDPRIHYFENEKNIGLIATLNKGFSLSTGELIARIDADDIWIDNNKLLKQFIFLKKNKEHVLVGTQAIIKKGCAAKMTNYPLEDHSIRNSLLSKNFFIHSSVLFKKILEDEPYKKEDYLVEDYSLWLRLGTKGKFANIPDFCVEYSINPKGLTESNNILQTKNSLILIKKFKDQYPKYHLSFLIWNIKMIIKKLLILLHLK